MAEHTTVVTEEETPEAFFEDRMRFWVAFARFAQITVALVVATLLFLVLFVY